MIDPTDITYGGKRVGDMTREELIAFIGELDGFMVHIGEFRHDVIEQCAVAAEALDRSGYEWLATSVWANILRRAGANVRKLKAEQLTNTQRPEEK